MFNIRKINNKTIQPLNNVWIDYKNNKINETQAIIQLNNISKNNKNLPKGQKNIFKSVLCDYKKTFKKFEDRKTKKEIYL